MGIDLRVMVCTTGVLLLMLLIRGHHLAEMATLQVAHKVELRAAVAGAAAQPHQLSQQTDVQGRSIALASPGSGACPIFKEKVFRDTVAQLDTLRAMGHFGMGSDCPASHQFGWRQPRLFPNIVGSYCEPWWRREAISLVDRLLDTSMTGIEYGSGTSSR